jgi:hypothetical protein
MIYKSKMPPKRTKRQRGGLVLGPLLAPLLMPIVAPLIKKLAAPLIKKLGGGTRLAGRGKPKARARKKKK